MKELPSKAELTKIAARLRLIKPMDEVTISHAALASAVNILDCLAEQQEAEKLKLETLREAHSRFRQRPEKGWTSHDAVGFIDWAWHRSGLPP